MRSPQCQTSRSVVGSVILIATLILSRVGCLARYEGYLLSQDVDMEALRLLSDIDFKELSIGRGARVKIQHALKK